MIKPETLGMLDIAKINPVLTSDEDVTNYSFITDDNDIQYLIMNTPTGDDAYKDGTVIPAGDYLNGYQLKAWEGQKLVIDGKHIDGGIDSISEGDTLSPGDDGLLYPGTSTSVYLTVTDLDATLTEPAIKAIVTVE